MRSRLVLVALVLTTAAIAAAVVPFGRAQDAQQQTATAAFEAPVDVDTAGLPGPKQPIFFRHDIHAGQYQLDCQYCHVHLELSPKPGIPSMASCRGCHLIVGTGNPEVDKLRTHFTDNTAVEWEEVHYLPPFVHFPHQRHIVAGLECVTCHGQVERMPQVYQYASLKMGWCLTCHEQQGVTTDCTACHY